MASSALESRLSGDPGGPARGSSAIKRLFASLGFAALAFGMLSACGDRGGSEAEPEPAQEESVAGDFPDALPLESLGQKVLLPDQYPDTYMIAGDWYGKREIIFDLTREPYPVVGSIGLGQLGAIVQSRDAIIGAAAHFSRTYYGTRTDVVTYFDRATLKPRDEIVLPQGKRAMWVEVGGMLELIDDERLLLVFNFTPAQSVSVVDLESNEVLSEIPIPGCSLIYPLAGRSFATLCGNGTIASYTVGENGEAVSETVSDAFNDVENDPMSAKYARIGDIDYFPTWGGNMQPVDMSGAVAAPGEAWPLVTDAEHDAGWRPTGIEPIAGRPDGGLYVLMRQDGTDGAHEKPASEIWAFDSATGERTGRWALANPGKLIAATQGGSGLIAVSNTDEGIDVYDLDGNHQRTLSLGFFPAIMWLYPVQAN